MGLIAIILVLLGSLLVLLLAVDFLFIHKILVGDRRNGVVLAILLFVLSQLWSRIDSSPQGVPNGLAEVVRIPLMLILALLGIVVIAVELRRYHLGKTRGGDTGEQKTDTKKH